MEYLASVVDMVSANPCVGPAQRIKVYFPYHQYAQIGSIRSNNNDIVSHAATRKWKLWTRTDSNTITSICVLYASVFLVSFIDPNKQWLNVKSVFTFLNHGLSV